MRLEDYKHLGLLGFTTLFCIGCAYNTACYGMGESERLYAAKKCNECMPEIERFYTSKQMIRITRDEKGKNIAKIIEE